MSRRRGQRTASKVSIFICFVGTSSKVAVPHCRESANISEFKKMAEMNDKREIFGWITYDWANSAFYTTVVSVLLGPYLTALAQSDVGRGGTVLSLGGYASITSDNLFTSTLGVSVFAQVFLLPILGSIADYTNLKSG